MRRKKPESQDRRRPENAELRRQIDLGQKQDVQHRLSDSQFRIARNADRVARLEKLAEVLSIRNARRRTET